MDRRQFVKTAGVTAAVGATGCLGGNGNGDGGDGDSSNGDGDSGDSNGDGNSESDTTVGQDGNATDLTGQDEVEVMVGGGEGGFRFDPADIVVDSGTTVVWTWTGDGGGHDVTHSDGETPYEPSDEQPPIQREGGGDTPLFKSELVNEEGHEFSYTFGGSGTYDYVCTVHVSQGMIGSVEVR